MTCSECAAVVGLAALLSPSEKHDSLSPTNEEECALAHSGVSAPLRPSNYGAASRLVCETDSVSHTACHFDAPVMSPAMNSL